MGLGLYVGDNKYAGWSYSGFNDFREKIASLAGIELSKMEGFADKRILHEQGFQAYKAAITGPDKISWDTVDDPIKLFLTHPDDSGTFEPEICDVIADRLERLMQNWVVSPNRIADFAYVEDYYILQARGLIEGLREASKQKVPVEFH